MYRGREDQDQDPDEQVEKRVNFESGKVEAVMQRPPKVRGERPPGRALTTRAILVWKETIVFSARLEGRHSSRKAGIRSADDVDKFII